MAAEKAKLKRADARRKLVAKLTLPLFVKLGYDKVSFQDISEATGVPRTAIYRYYRTKRQIFDAAILEVILELRGQIAAIRAETASAPARLRGVCAAVADLLFRERAFVQVIFNFVMEKIASGENMAVRVMEFTNGLKTAFAKIVAEGISESTLKASASPEIVAELFFANVESTALKMLLGIETDSAAAKHRMNAAIASLEA